MGYYDDDDEYYSDCYGDDDHVEPVSIAGDFSEKALTDIIISAGLTSESRPKYSGTMERLVFMYGEDREVYSPAEIRFIDSIENVYVYQEFTKLLNQGNMVCRTIATKINSVGHEALKACVSFEKIIDKALDGFNIFFFVTEDNVFFGCRLFDKAGRRDCALSKPIEGEYAFEQYLDELSFLAEISSFMEYYSYFKTLITENQDENEDYEHLIMRRRGIQMSYLDDICRIERDMGLNMSGEKERYKRMFNDEPEETFASLLDEVEESLAFIKSNRINTYEMLFEADEMMREAEAAEAENERLAAQVNVQASTNDNTAADEEAKALLEDPEEMIKLLKKRRGL